MTRDERGGWYERKRKKENEGEIKKQKNINDEKTTNK